MSEAGTRTETPTKPRTARQAVPGSADLRSPFEMPGLEIPEPLRDIAVRWIDQTKEAFERAMKVTEEMNGAFEGACSTATKGNLDFGAKVMEAAYSNMSAAFDLAHDLLAADSLPEAMAASSVGARKQFEALAAQNRELWTLSQQLMTEAVKPITGNWRKVFDVAG